MKFHRTRITFGVAGAALAASLIALPGPALGQSADTGAASGEQASEHPERFRAHVQTRLQRMAERLAITPGQQTAWDTFAKTVEGTFGTKRARPPADADAASLLRFRAQTAGDHAQRLAQLADATAALQEVLTPEQRQTLNEMMRHGGRGMHSRRGGHDHKRGG